MSVCDLPPQYVHGIELFNAACFFDAHEVWEELWLQADGPERTLLHALIQTAAALHHVQHGNLKGAVSIWPRAHAKLLSLPGPRQVLDTGAFVAECERYFTQILTGTNQQLPFPKIHLHYGNKT